MLHTAIGQNVHLRGRPWLYYVYEKNSHHTIPLRHDWFGFANYTGAIGALFLIALLAASSDFALRSMGTPQWKKLQRWNYLLFALVGAHTIAYQASEKQEFPFVFTGALCMVLTVALQVVGFMRRRAEL